MHRIVYTITDENGIHARPAGKIVAEAKKYKANIRLHLPIKDRSVDAKKLFALMGLGVKKGDTIHIEAEGEDAEEALQAIEAMLAESGL